MPQEWCDKNFEYRAKKGGVSRAQPIYKDYSNMLHNSPTMLYKYVHAPHSRTLALNTGPMFNLSTWRIAFVCNVFGLCLKKANEHFELGAEVIIEEAHEKFQQYAEAVNA